MSRKGSVTTWACGFKLSQHSLPTRANSGKLQRNCHHQQQLSHVLREERSGISTDSTFNMVDLV